jgi:hypothetical protein
MLWIENNGHITAVATPNISRIAGVGSSDDTVQVFDGDSLRVGLFTNYKFVGWKGKFGTVAIHDALSVHNIWYGIGFGTMNELLLMRMGAKLDTLNLIPESDYRAPGSARVSTSKVGFLIAFNHPHTP